MHRSFWLQQALASTPMIKPALVMCDRGCVAGPADRPGKPLFRHLLPLWRSRWHCWACLARPEMKPMSWLTIVMP